MPPYEQPEQVPEPTFDRATLSAAVNNFILRYEAVLEEFEWLKDSTVGMTDRYSLRRNREIMRGFETDIVHHTNIALTAFENAMEIFKDLAILLQAEETNGFSASLDREINLKTQNGHVYMRRFHADFAKAKEIFARFLSLFRLGRRPDLR